MSVEHRVARDKAGFYCLDCPWLAPASESVAQNVAVMHAHGVHTVCPRRQCRGQVPHSWVTHWFGWVRR